MCPLRWKWVSSENKMFVNVGKRSVTCFKKLSLWLASWGFNASTNWTLYGCSFKYLWKKGNKQHCQRFRPFMKILDTRILLFQCWTGLFKLLDLFSNKASTLTSFNDYVKYSRIFCALQSANNRFCKSHGRTTHVPLPKNIP